MEDRVLLRGFRIGLIVVALVGLAWMGLFQSRTRPSDSSWWLWVVITVIADITFAASGVWWAMQPKDKKPSLRAQCLKLGSLLVVLALPGIVRERVGDYAWTWFWGLALVSLTVGLFLGRAILQSSNHNLTVTAHPGQSDA